MTMGYGDPGNSIEQDSRRGGGEKRGNPIPEASTEPPAFLKEKLGQTAEQVLLGPQHDHLHFVESQLGKSPRNK
jgi:hypothetical protein